MSEKHYIDNDFSLKIRSISAIKKIIIHCSDSDINAHDDISVIKKWHLDRGFSDIGYHFFITKNGIIQKGRNVKFIGAHCLTQNAVSIGICLSGRNVFSDLQIVSSAKLIQDLIKAYNISISEVFPHNYFDKNKTCPNFDIALITAKI